MRRLITCPDRGCLVEIEAKERHMDGRLTHTTACSLSRHSFDLDCAERCAQRMNRKRMAARTRR
jgi:hypothetical protein